jgi:uncharacterized phage-like protein YoqJ
MGKTLCFTGHRPDKLGGFGGEKAKLIQDNLFAHLVRIVMRAANNDFDRFISGGALGVDQIAAEAVIHRKKNPAYFNIQLIIAKPFPSQASKWPAHAVEVYDRICGKADTIVNVSEDPYTREKMQLRNEFMVNHSDAVIAVWNGGNGGTGNCVRYARSQFKPILIVNPYTLVEKWELPNKIKW